MSGEVALHLRECRAGVAMRLQFHVAQHDEVMGGDLGTRFPLQHIQQKRWSPLRGGDGGREGGIERDRGEREREG